MIGAYRRPNPADARMVAYDVLRAVDEQDAYANLVLPAMLARRGVHGVDAALATELAYGTLRLRGRYDPILALATGRDVAELDPEVLDVLRLGAHQILAMRIPDHAAVSRSVDVARARIHPGAAALVNAALRTLCAHDLAEWLDRAVPAGAPEAERLAVTHSHPRWIVEAMRQALVAHGRSVEELGDLLAADNVSAPVTLAARPGLIDREDLIAQLPGGAEECRWAPTAVRMTQGDPGRVRAVREGLAGVQDEASQLVTLALAQAPVDGSGNRGPARRTEDRDPGRGGYASDGRDTNAPDALWADICAGPGGKAAMLGALAAERGGHLVAGEIAPHRAELVRRAVQALGEAVEVLTVDGREFGVEEPATYDRVLVDAPCTGVGALRRRPEARWRRTPADLAGLAPLQRELLASALDATRPGGVVAYATCSPLVAETTIVVEDVLRRRTDVQILDAAQASPLLAEADARTPEGFAQLWPHVHGTDAMFLALLRRTS